MQQQIATSKLCVNYQPLLRFCHLKIITNTQADCLITSQNIKRKFENIMRTGNQVFWRKFKVIIEKVMRQFLKFVLKYFLSQNFSLPTAMINKMEKESTPRLSTDVNNIKGSSFK